MAKKKQAAKKKPAAKKPTKRKTPSATTSGNGKVDHRRQEVQQIVKNTLDRPRGTE